jgi:hypothetical protein
MKARGRLEEGSRKARGRLKEGSRNPSGTLVDRADSGRFGRRIA